MLDILQKFFNQSNLTNNETALPDELMLLCGIMVEAANIDGQINQNEILKIKTALVNIFHEEPKEVDSVLTACLKQSQESNSLHSFTSKMNKLFNEEKKINLLEILWEIVLIDGHVHDYESNLIRRLAGLLYISDVDCGNAKKRALSKLKINLN